MTERTREHYTPSRGEVRVSNDIVAKIAQIAASEVEGVADFDKGPISWLNIFGLNPSGQSVKVEVGAKEVAVDLDIAVNYGSRIPEIVRNIRKNVSQRITDMTGLEVVELNISVNNIRFPDERLSLTSDGENPEPRVR